MTETAPNVSQGDRPAPYTADDPIIQDLAPLLLTSAYACGGSIIVKKRTEAKDEGVTAPVTLRWDAAEQIEKLVFPDPDPAAVQALVKSTQPASFGRNGKDVVDESYRKASKLDPTAFSTNFCPYAAGIIDSIGQALLPLPNNSSQGIRAELYKLNVYEGPYGMFKPHLDTPRSDLHFGSLVVCLPAAHEGGQLSIHHQGHTTTFDWSKDTTNLQWAAFYGDCEHEVSQVTSGYRITLTYNLFIRRGLGEMVGNSSTLNAVQLPVYKEVSAALSNPVFFPDGGYLAKYCSHAYAHATKEGIRALPAVLKGSDMVTYEVFHSLGVQVSVRPSLDLSQKRELGWFDEYDSDGNEYEGEYFEHDQIGKKLAETVSTELSTEYCSMREMVEEFPNDKLKVKWLNEPVVDTKNVQFIYLAYGNQASLGYEYSFCVLLMSIPPYAERAKMFKGRELKVDTS